jgi:hypothetical protein
MKNFEISNTSLCDVKWKIINIENLEAKNFKVSPNEGELKIKEN